jgi:amino acid adenylation domain-containing protein
MVFMEVPSTTGFQLSPQQRRLWSLQAAGLPLWASVVVSLEGDLDAARLRTALETLVTRFEILRTSFQRSSGVKFPFQVVQSSTGLEWKTADLSTIAPEKQTSEIDLLLQKQVESTDVETPTVRAILVSLGKQRHAFLLGVPGMCTDKEGLGLLVQHLAASYSGQASVPNEDQETLQYADYAAWQNELPQDDEDAARAAEFWKTHLLAGVPPVALPFARKTTSDNLFRPQLARLHFDSSKQDAATKDVIEKAGTAAFLLAAWQIFLWRITGQAEIVTNFRSNGRQYEEVKNTLGLFNRFLPVGSNFEADPKFSTFLEQTRGAMAEAVEWQDRLPFAYSENEPAGCFVMDSYPPAHKILGVTFAILRMRAAEHRARLTLHVEKSSTGWDAALHYDSTVLPQDAAERFARSFGTLLRGAASNPGLAVSRLPMLDAAERQTVVTTFNQTAAEFPKDRCLHDLFEDQARKNPSRPALRCGNDVYSYAELNAQANRLAHALRRRGVKANVSVGLCIERSAEMIVGLLGILKAGGCYVPLVPDSPKARLAHQLRETGAPVLLTQEKLLGNLPDYRGTVLCLDRDREQWNSEPIENPEHINSPQDLAYVIYTSGSTGVPKGVAVRHSSLMNYTHFMASRLNLPQHPEGLHFATVSTISADLGNTAIFPSLSSGGCLHVIGFEMAMAANVFAEYVAKYPLDVLKITPSHLSTLLKSPGGEGLLPGKFLVLGGEASSWDFVRQIMQAGKCAVLNHYGPTEATVGCCTFAVWENDVSAWQPATVPVGRPIANDTVYIVNSHLEPVPIGVAGELCVGGAGLAQGYLNQPETTAERFVPNPFQSSSDEPADVPARMYRTGDLARFLPDGNIEFLGRIDHQVKIRGFRVEPAEIQAALRKHAAVQHTVVTPYDDKNGEKRLAAYVVARVPIKPSELRSFLQSELPEYMVPSSILLLQQLPLTANGKVDLRALPAPEAEDAKQEREFVAPSSPEDERMAAIWREVLKKERVSVHDNFFELGGHSLLATQIISRIRNGFQVQIPLHSFLETPTVAQLAEKVRHAQPAESEDAEMARLLQEIDGLSEEDAERLLAQHLEDTEEKQR